jgi:hypothetical protein
MAITTLKPTAARATLKSDAKALHLVEFWEERADVELLAPRNKAVAHRWQSVALTMLEGDGGFTVSCILARGPTASASEVTLAAASLSITLSNNSVPSVLMEAGRYGKYSRSAVTCTRPDRRRRRGRFGIDPAPICLFQPEQDRVSRCNRR